MIVRINNHDPRRGMGLVLAVVLLAMVAAAIGGMVRELALRRGISDRAERHTQAVLLAEAGLSRARALIERDPSYTGETWKVPARSIGGRNSAEVFIAVKEEGEVVAVATYPAGDDDTRARVTRRERIITGQRPE
jgi:type II secretory pathway component PulK